MKHQGDTNTRLMQTNDKEYLKRKKGMKLEEEENERNMGMVSREKEGDDDECDL